jgi:hypothetical protein
MARAIQGDVAGAGRVVLQLVVAEPATAGVLAPPRRVGSGAGRPVELVGKGERADRGVGVACGGTGHEQTGGEGEQRGHESAAPDAPGTNGIHASAFLSDDEESGRHHGRTQPVGVDDRDASKDDEGLPMAHRAIDEPPSSERYGFLTVDVNTRLELSADLPPGFGRRPPAAWPSAGYVGGSSR